MEEALFNVFVQGLGFVAVGVNAWAVQFNKHWQIILLKTIGSFLFVVQYFFLKAYTGMAMDAIGIVRNVLFIFTVKSKKTTLPWIILFSVLTLVLGIATYEGVISLLVIVAKLLSCISYGMKNPRVIRGLNLPSSMLWLTYNAIYFSLAGIMNEVLLISSIIIAEIRLYNKEKRNKKNEDGCNRPWNNHN